MDAFVSGAGICSVIIILQTFDCFTGTGGTIAGTGQFMKIMNKDVMIVLADPEGSGLYNKVRSSFSLQLIPSRNLTMMRSL